MLPFGETNRGGTPAVVLGLFSGAAGAELLDGGDAIAGPSTGLIGSIFVPFLGCLSHVIDESLVTNRLYPCSLFRAMIYAVSPAEMFLLILIKQFNKAGSRAPIALAVCLSMKRLRLTRLALISVGNVLSGVIAD